MDYVSLSIAGDDILGRQIANECELAMSVFHKRYYQEFRSRAYKWLGTADDADLVASEVMVKVWKSAHRWDPDGKGDFYMFVCGIVRNTINEVRKDDKRNKRLRPWNYVQKRLPESRDDAYDVLDYVACEQSGNVVDGIVYDARENEVLDAISRSLLRMTPLQRLSFYLTQYCEYGNTAASEIIKTNPSNVGQALGYAKKHLQRHLSYLVEA